MQDNAVCCLPTSPFPFVLFGQIPHSTNAITPRLLGAAVAAVAAVEWSKWWEVRSTASDLHTVRNGRTPGRNSMHYTTECTSLRMRSDVP